MELQWRREYPRVNDQHETLEIAAIGKQWRCIVNSKRETISKRRARYKLGSGEME